MKFILTFATGFIFCLIVGLGFFTYQKATHPLGAIVNQDFPLIEVSRENGGKLFDLKKGESKFLDYGEYTISIPQIKSTIHLFKIVGEIVR